MEEVPLLEARHVTKAYGGLLAANDLSVVIRAGEVLGLVGHNGAGKSTFVGCISGAIKPDAGEIFVDGIKVNIGRPSDALGLGIEVMYQNLALAENLGAAANIFLGREMRRWFGRNDRAMKDEALRVLKQLSTTITDVTEAVRNLSGGQRQLIAMARVLYFHAKVLIMDEPTAALGPEESRTLKGAISRLKAAGVGIMLISHDMEEVFEMTDRVMVLHNGKEVGTCNTLETTQDELLSMIILGKAPAGRIS
jgi:D-xylose transport system ATP-binding protein